MSERIEVEGEGSIEVSLPGNRHIKLDTGGLFYHSTYTLLSGDESRKLRKALKRAEAELDD